MQRSSRKTTGGRASLLALGLAAVIAGCGGAAGGANGSDGHDGLFVDVTEAVGLDFVYHNGMAGDRTFHEIMGPGGAVLDFDNDGDLDIYAVQGHSLARDRVFEGEDAPIDRLFRNELAETGDLRFTDVTEASGIRAIGYGMGAATGDFDNDGDVDIYVLNWGDNQLWRNDGDGTFSDVTEGSGTNSPWWSSGATFFDYDRDGWLDLLVVNYLQVDRPVERITGGDYTTAYDFSLEGTSPGCEAAEPDCEPSIYVPQRNQLFRNLGDGTFEDVTANHGFGTVFGPALGVAAADFNGDGWLDVYIANDGRANELWINDAGRGFRERAGATGAALNGAGVAEASMGVAVADFDDDGDADVFLTHLSDETNTLYRNTGDALRRFDDLTDEAGLGQPSEGFTGFGTVALDYDLDGDLDLFVANGEVEVIAAQSDQDEALPFRQRNQLFRNEGGGRFVEVSPAAEPVLAIAEVTRGVSRGDIDNDGDPDLVVFNNSAPLRLLRNEASAGPLWLGLAFSPGSGAVLVDIIRASGDTLRRWGHTDGSYLSAHDPRVLVSLGGGAPNVTVRVTWPDGSVEEWAGLDLSRYHELRSGGGAAVEVAR